MGLHDEKRAASYVSSVPGESQEPLRSSGHASSMPSLAEKDSVSQSFSHFFDENLVLFGHSKTNQYPQIYKKYIRIFRFVTRLLSVVLNALVIGTLSLSLYKYYTTKSRTWTPSSSNDPGHLWPLSPTLWPTFVLLGIAVMTFIINLFTLLAYCCGVGAANKVSSVSTWLTTIFLGIHFAAWIVATGSYKIWSSESTLWGWSCSSAADELTAAVGEVKSFVDFGKLCDMQVCFSLSEKDKKLGVADVCLDGYVVYFDC